MNSLLDALAKANLATRNDQLASEIDEAQSLRDKQAQFIPKTLEDLAARKDYGFFAKVEWLVDYIESDPTERKMIEVQNFVEGHMMNGKAGTEFHMQLHELRVGIITLSQLKAKWPKIWKS